MENKYGLALMTKKMAKGKRGGREHKSRWRKENVVEESIRVDTQENALCNGTGGIRNTRIEKPTKIKFRKGFWDSFFE